MPSGEELAAMTPREAADRLFDRAMREKEAGNEAAATQFATMGLAAYERVTGPALDSDARFHMGLLALSIGDFRRARGEAESLLAGDPQDLFGLLLLVRVAEEEALPEERERRLAALRAAVEAGVSPGSPRFELHANLIEEALAGAGG